MFRENWWQGAILLGLVVIAAGCGLFSSSYVDHTANNGTATPATPATPGSPSPGGGTIGYASTIQAFLASSCARAGCHVSAGQSPDLSTYSGASQNGARALIRINAGTMPPGGGLSATDKANFASWVNAGYPQ